ncbi:MAG: cytochrome c oxidase subunit II [Magnetospiraceae bacterium]
MNDDGVNMKHFASWGRWLVAAPGSLIALAFFATSAMADQPHPWQMWSQEPATPVMAEIDGLHTTLTWIMTAIVIFVLILLIYVMWRFNEKRNPVPSKNSHNTLLEIAWTGIPVLILVGIASPSLSLLFYMDKAQDADITIKAIAHQWYWSYEYPDHGDFTFDAFIKEKDDLAEGEPRLLTTDTQVVVPVDTTIRILTASDDVIHSWAVPALGVKIDSVPGRVQESWFKIAKEGTYYGQCSELCGVNHGFMPIMVQVVSKEEFATWAAEQQAALDGPGNSPMIVLSDTETREQIQ